MFFVFLRARAAASNQLEEIEQIRDSKFLPEIDRFTFANYVLTRITSNKKLPEPPPFPNRNKPPEPRLLRISLNLDRRPVDFFGASVVLDVSSKNIRSLKAPVPSTILITKANLESYQQKSIVLFRPERPKRLG